MLAKRVIPTMLCRGRTLVKGERFNSWRSIGHVLQAARVHAKRGVDELLILDIAATAEGRGPDLQMVSDLAADCFIPITVGGGVRSLKDIDALLRAGADKVAVCTWALDDVHAIRKATSRFGRQAIVAVVEYRPVRMPGWDTDRIGTSSRCGELMRFSLDGDPFPPVGWAQDLDQYAQVGEIVLSSVDRDGTMTGYDLDLIRQVSQAVSVPVIASGGCSGYEDMLAAFQAGADACAAGALFAFTDATPKGAAQFLKRAGMEVRL